MQLTRRSLLAGAAASAAFGIGGARAEPVLTDDGLYKEPWFLESLLDLKDDVEGAFADDKRLVIMWELKGCPYCKETHFVNFARGDIAGYVEDNFKVLQLNIIGSRKVTDFDGEELSEKALAAKYNVRYTPTLQFFPERAGQLKFFPPSKREVTRAAGYLRPDDFLALFRYVREKVYETKTFREFLKTPS